MPQSVTSDVFTLHYLHVTLGRPYGPPRPTSAAPAPAPAAAPAWWLALWAGGALVWAAGA